MVGIVEIAIPALVSENLLLFLVNSLLYIIDMSNLSLT